MRPFWSGWPDLNRLESFYGVPAYEAAGLVRSVIAFAPIRTRDPALLPRSLEVYETHCIDFAEA